MSNDTSLELILNLIKDLPKDKQSEILLWFTKHHNGWFPTSALLPPPPSIPPERKFKFKIF